MKSPRSRVLGSIAVLLLLIPLSAAAANRDVGERERLAPNRMPNLEGQSFAATIDAAGREATAVFNINEGMVSLYLYVPDQNLLRVLYSVPADVVQSGEVWSISVPTRGVAFTLAKGDDQRIVVDGQPSKLRLIDRGALEGVRVEKAPDCAAASINDQGAPPADRQSPTERHLDVKDDSLATCAMALAFNGCCTSCYCVHRELGIPYWVDSLCCLGGCNEAN